MRQRLSPLLLLSASILAAPGEALQSDTTPPAGVVGSPSQGPERIELFPWEDPLTGWEPFEFRWLLRGQATIDIDDPTGPEEESGFPLHDARLSVAGAIDDGVHFRFTVDGGDEGERPSGELEVLEGWAAFDLGERHAITAGRYRRPFLRSAIVDQSTLLFFDRTTSGIQQNVYDLGARIDGRYEFVDLTFSVQNGEDGAAEERLAVARAELHLLGDGVPLEDSLYRIARRQQLSIAAAYADETGSSGGDRVALDGAWRYDRFALTGEWIDNGGGVGDNSPWSLTASWLPLPEEWVVGLRFQDNDDALNSRVLSGVAKRYLVRGRIAGHFQIDRVNSNSSDLEGWRFAFGTTLTF